MRKSLSLSLLALAFFVGTAGAQNPVRDTSKTIQNGVLVVNTTSLCENVEGYIGPTPVEIRIKKDTIVKVTALPNEETPAYFKLAVKVLEKWIGLTPSQGLELKVDAVSGATFSSEALIDNMRAGLKRALEE
ncbi:MAG: FMN-binding protein [Bacteroidales bacterium]|nr:FMN-binding protein [Bacteroidales bacterium]